MDTICIKYMGVCLSLCLSSFSLFATLHLTIVILFKKINAFFRPFNGVENIYVSRFEKITIKLGINKVKQRKGHIIIIKYGVAMVLGQMSDGTNVGWDKHRMGQTTDGTNIGWDKHFNTNFMTDIKAV